MAFAVTNPFYADTLAIAGEVNQNFADVGTELNAFPTNGALKAGGVGLAALADGILTADAAGRAKMADSFVNTAKIADDAVTTDKIADTTITNANIHASAAIAVTKLGAGGTACKIGTYTGDGVATRAITGVGFQPTILFVFPGTTASDPQYSFVKTSDMGLNSKELGGGNTYTTDLIISLDANGFTVGDGTGTEGNLNNDGTSYFYIAIRANT